MRFNGIQYVVRISTVCVVGLALVFAEQPDANSDSDSKEQLLQRQQIEQLTMEAQLEVSKQNFLAAAGKAREAIELQTDLSSDIDPKLISLWQLVSNAAEVTNDWDAGEKARSRILQIATAAFPPSHYQITDARAYQQRLIQLRRLSDEQRGIYQRAMQDYRLASALYDESRYEQGITPARAAMSACQELFGIENPDTLAITALLGSLYLEQSNYAAAAPHLQKALDEREKLLGAEHPLTMGSHKTLGSLFVRQGNLAAAETHYVKAWEISEKIYGKDDPQTADCLEYIGDILVSQGHTDVAISCYRRAMEIYERKVGPHSSGVARCLDDLSLCYKHKGNYVEAERLTERALEIETKNLGADHPDIAICAGNLAQSREALGKIEAAETLYRRSIKIMESYLGPDHPDTLGTVYDLARCLWKQSKTAEAITFARRVIEARRVLLENTAPIQSELQQMLMLMANESHEARNIWMTVTSGETTNSQSWQEIMPWKGLTTARQSLIRKSLGNNPIWNEYREVVQQLSTVSLSPPTPPKDPDQLAKWKTIAVSERAKWAELKSKLEREQERIERQLVAISAEFRLSHKRQQVTVDEIKRALAQQAKPTALIDLNVYAISDRDFDNAKYRLAAHIVRGEGEIVRVELGDAQVIENLVNKWRETFGNGEVGRSAAESLREQLWEPLECHLAEIEIVLISPDGVFGKLPWGVIPGNMPGTYLIEERSFAVIPIPQFLPELLAKDSSVSPPSQLLLVGDIDYGGDPGSTESLLALRSAGGNILRDSFTTLPGSQAELATIERRYRKHAPKGTVTSLDGTSATEAAFCAMAGKHTWLHLSTHGYFSQEPLPSITTEVVPENTGPLHQGLLSGLAFAGASRPPEPGKDDGILTALDVSGLDLREVDTVVLSACETGLGTVAGGEGLLGLQRAFMVAGAKTCVASLWKVPDAATARLMQRFYENLWDKNMGKLEALREAQIWMLHDRGARGLVLLQEQSVDAELIPPYFWAAFVLSGDWR